MTPKQHALACVTRLAQSKNANVSAEVLKVYAELLADLPPDDLAAACKTLATTKTFGLPQAGEIRDAVIAATVGDVRGRALTAWAEVMRACRVAGAYRSIECEDVATGEALRIAAGSWPHLCRMELGSFELSKVRETFLEMYERLAAHPTADQPVRLSGMGTTQPPYRIARVDGLQLSQLAAPAESKELPPSKQEAAAILDRITKRITA